MNNINIHSLLTVEMLPRQNRALISIKAMVRKSKGNAEL